MDEIYKEKYIKYKDKYITLKEGGAINTTDKLANIILDILSRSIGGISSFETTKLEKYKTFIKTKYQDKYTYELFKKKIHKDTLKRILEYTDLEKFFTLFKKFIFDNNNEIYNLNEEKLKRLKIIMKEESDAAFEIAKLKHIKQEKLKKIRDVLNCSLDNVKILDCGLDNIIVSDQNKCNCKE
jgi:hypothetical protein